MISFSLPRWRWFSVTGLAVLPSLWCVPADASATLTASQIIFVQQSIRGGIDSTRGSPAGIQEAVYTPIKQLVADSGEENAAALTSLSISVAEAAGASESNIGQALAKASVSFAPKRCRGPVETGEPLLDCRIAAAAVAVTLANEGKAGEILAYQTTVISMGYPKLALIAGQSPVPVGESLGSMIAGINTGGGFVGCGGNGGGGCLNPSCTKLR